MKIIRKNSLAPRRSLEFSIVPFQSVRKDISRAAEGEDTIELSYSHAAPANPSDVMTPINRNFELPMEGAPHAVTAAGTVDDAVSMSIDGITKNSESGAPHPFELTIDGLSGGLHCVSIVHTNINYDPPSGNISMLSGSVGPCPPVGIVPDENEEEKPDCECDDEDEGGDPPDSNARSFRNSVGDDWGSSSAGSSMIREAELRYMRWAASFGTFRGLGGIPGGRLELMGYQYDASLLTPMGLTYRHPAASVVLVPEGGVAPNELFRVYEGGAYTNYICDANGNAAFGVGSTSSTTCRAEFVTALSKESSVVTTLAQASYLRVAKTNGTATFYNLITGEFVGYISSRNYLLTSQDAENYLSILRQEDGSIRQIWNLWDGLADIVPSETGTGYTIAFYLPGQVASNDSVSGLYTVTGEPFKTFTISGDATTKTLVVTERDLTLPDGMPSYITNWIETQGIWNIIEGMGEESVITKREKKDLLEEGTYQVVTTVSKGGLAVSVVAENYLSHITGELLLSMTEGYGSLEAQTTTYEYDDVGRVICILSPDGGETRSIHDAKGRISVTTKPWAGGKSRLIQTNYLDDGSEYSNFPSQVDVNFLTPAGIPQLHLRETYTYSTVNQIKRIEKRSTANGITRLEITETWQGDAKNTYARGRARMTQAINGVQTWYDYATTNQYGALYTVTAETRINGESVAGQSSRNVRYVTAQGNAVREEEWILDSQGTWRMLSFVDYEFDAQNRWIRKTRSNGRSTTRSLMCTGHVLRETDENGVLTTYSYDSTRQLVETIRSATPTTPETITSYTRDAAGRILQTRTDIGAMTTTKSQTYDLLGRIVTATDELGRTSSYGYSADGLTTTMTTPSGATIITTDNADGSIAHDSGTGQRELYHVYDYNGGRIRETVKLADQTTILSQTLQNGFGDAVVVTSPTTIGYLYDRTTYNEKGQIVQTVRDTGSGLGSVSMSPTLFEYDNFGNLIKETWRHNASPTTANSRITTYAYTVEDREDGVYRVTTLTKNNAEGNTYMEISARLLSESILIENQREETDARGNISLIWTEYGTGTTRIQKNKVPTSTHTASTTIVDGFKIAQTDHAGITTSQTRIYTASGLIITQTDGRGNTITTRTDIAGRTLSVTDAAGNTTVTAYCTCCDNPSTITDAMGNVSHYRYDIRNRKLAEWGSNTHPACFTYDNANRMVSLTTFRVKESDIVDDPTDRTDGDTTMWEYHDATGFEIRKTYVDGTTILREYNILGLLGHVYNARGDNATYIYNTDTGTLKTITHTDGTASQNFTYNQLAHIKQITDASGTRTFEYNEYDKLISEALNGDAVTHLVAEAQDDYGRNIGYTYTKAGAVQQTVSLEYGADGRLAAAAFLYGGAEQQFRYGYLSGSHLLHTLAHPNNILVTKNYEQHRSLPTSMNATRGATDVVLRGYTYDQLGRPVTRTCSRQAKTRNDNFGYNGRSELTSASLGTNPYVYAYDNIGNRKTAQEIAEEISYDANNINQYTSIIRNETAFIPTFDTDGNQTLIQTSTGVWTVVYNADNRPVCFTKTEGDQMTRIECGYDYMGRRYMKKVTVNGLTTIHHRYVYRGYLQIACVDLTRSGHPSLWLTMWDPGEPVATRPLAIQKNGTWYTYGHDLTKNVTELYNTAGGIASAYDYMPFGTVTFTGIEQPFQWSSEFFDIELDLVYYNYRHYNPTDGTWVSRDPIGETAFYNVYVFVKNHVPFRIDYLGKSDYKGYLCNGTMLPPSAYTTIDPCWYCPKDSKTRLIPGKTSCCEYRTTNQKSGYDPAKEANGCGSEGGSVQPPDDFDMFNTKVNFLPACTAHDICYGTCGSDKSSCDSTFYNNMKQACRDAMIGKGSDLMMLEACHRLAQAYYIAVTIGGFGPHEKAQDKACEWKKCK